MKSNWRLFCGLAYAVIAALSLYTAFILRFDFAIPHRELKSLWIGLGIAIPLKAGIFCERRQSTTLWWHYAGIADVPHLARINLLASVLFTLIVFLVLGPEFSRSIYCLDPLISFLLTAGLMFGGRLQHELLHAPKTNSGTRGLIVYGAGVAGITLAREARSNPSLGYAVLGFLDDDVHKQGSTLMALPILGTGDDASRIAKIFQNRRPALAEIVITMPSATRAQIRRALEKCAGVGVPVRVVPGLGELISGKLGLAATRDLCVNDLLRREPVALDLLEARQKFFGRSVLVTGAAGSIGSELCRQLAAFTPRTLVALDQAESELFRLDWELREKFPVDIVAEVGDIRDAARMDEVIRAYSVEAVFHAAAYKHVPMMETHVLEAVKNNVLGTWNVAEAAYRNHVSTFLMISSDKAVNPTSIMGLTKRTAELITAGMPKGERSTLCMSVRFGNVLVSNGSVVPTFQRQIASGGPVTVTHPDVKRYFMTVQEAVQLVIHASTLGRGSEIFVLDMGEPVRIIDLAADMIRQAGFIPNEDIEIRIVGLRPGEKLFEELRLEGENVLPTSHEKIKKFQGPHVDRNAVLGFISELRELVEQRNEDGALRLLRDLIPEYQPAPIEKGLAVGASSGRCDVVMKPGQHGIERPLGLRTA